MKIKWNIVALFACWLLSAGAGVYLTYFEQPAEIEHLEQAEQVARLKNAELLTLQDEHNSLTGMTEEALRKWHARYKVIPKRLEAASIIGYLNDLTAEGFLTFDLKYSGKAHKSDYSYHSFSINGKSYFSSLYRFIWEIENNRNFYRVADLSLDQMDLSTLDPDTGRERLEVMVSFTMTIRAYFNGIDGISAEDQAYASEDERISVSQNRELPPVPLNLLPAQKLPLNPFFPIIMKKIPPNTYGLVDVEHATLISIVDGKAMFQDGDGFRAVGVGDAVYLGQVLQVDPFEGRVVVRLNKGGIIDEVELRLDTGERFRQARGSLQFAPTR